MIVAVNDISFLWGCKDRYVAKDMLILFSNVMLGIKDDKVSNVNVPFDIINSDSVHQGIELAPDYTLIQALEEIKIDNWERAQLLIYLLTQCGNDEAGEEFFTIGKYKSQHIAKYRDCFLISLRTDELFEGEFVRGKLNGSEDCEIRNLSQESHLEKFWPELGFREYELNGKHGRKEYIRSGGYEVGEAPETDELGQFLLNRVVDIRGKLYAVDYEKDRIFEFRHTGGNCYHAFCQKRLPKDMVSKIKRESDKQWGRKR